MFARFFLFLLLTVFFGRCFADQPLLSSKAMRVAMQAKKYIHEPDVEHIKEAVSSLEGLLHDASFLRLDPQFQVDILFILSKGYERLERFTDQEKLLLSFARKRELYRYHVLLKTTLIRSYIRQERIFESETLLSKFTKPSLAFLSLEEKIEIAKTVFFIEDHLHSLLKTADTQTKNFSLKEALKNYKTVLTSLERFGFPFQASLVEKRHLRHTLLLRIAEMYYLQKDFQQTLLFLSHWKDDPSENDVLSNRRQELFALTHAQQGISCPLPFPQEIEFSTSPETLIWMAHEAIQQKDITSLEKIIETLHLHNKVEFSSLLHILQGFKEALLLNTTAAYNELEKGLSTANIWTNPWKESAMNLLSELGWQRVLLLTLSSQEKKAHTLCSQTIQRISTASAPETILKTAALHLLDYFLEKQPSSLETCTSLLQTLSTTPISSNNLYITLTSSLKQTDIPSNLSSLPLEDQTFFFLYSKKNIPSFIKSDSNSPLTAYFNALSSYNQAVKGSISDEQAFSSLKVAIEKAPDAAPQIYCYLIDLFLRTNQIRDACEITSTLIQKYPDYIGTESSLLTCSLALQSRPEFFKETLLFNQTLCNNPFSLQSFLLTINIFESKSPSSIELSTDQKKFLLSLSKRSEAKNALSQATKSKEPGVIKNKIEETHFSFTAAENAAKELLNSLPPSSSAIPPLSGYILSVESEHIDLLEKSIIEPYAFNELPAYLTSLAATFLQDLSTYKDSEPLLQNSFLQECFYLGESAKIYTAAFARDFDAVTSFISSLTTQSPLFSSYGASRGILFAAKTLRESKKTEEAYSLLSHLDETVLKNVHYELALDIALEKSLCLKDLNQIKKAMTMLAWVINSPCASSLRIKAMIVRADIYVSINRLDLAVKQLQSVVNKGGEWGVVAERKIESLTTKT